MTFRNFQRNILNTPVTCMPFEDQVMLMLKWAKHNESRNICLANVHMLMEAYWNPNFAQILNKADLVTPDGMPLVWILRKLGVFNQNQVAGMDVFLNLCELAQQNQIGVYFLGSEENLLRKIRERLQKDYPIIKISGMEALPHLPVEKIVSHRDQFLIERINQSGAGLVFVCLGCPKQEIWMGQYKGSIKAVMIGIGAVFSMYAKVNVRAPYWMRIAGLEWMYRLYQEPKRLWRRYGTTIPPFIYLAIRQLLDLRKKKAELKSAKDSLLELENLDFSPSKIGEILVRQSLLTQQDLDQALSQQKYDRETKIGEILVRNHKLSLPELRFYLHNQSTKLEEVLVEKKLISKKKLEQLLEDIQAQESELSDCAASLCERKLGDLLIQQNLISQEQLRSALLEYFLRRKGFSL